MKKLLLFALCSLLLIAPALMAGCAGTPKAVAYKTLKAVGDSVDVAMEAYADAVVAGEISLESQAHIKKLHDQYRTAFSKAVIAAGFNDETAAPSEVVELASELVSHVTSFAH